MKAGDATQRTTLKAQQVKAGDTASGNESRDVKTLRTGARVKRHRKARRKRRRKAVAAVPWRVARGEDRRWCQYRGALSKAKEAFCCACLEHETETR